MAPAAIIVAQMPRKSILIGALDLLDPGAAAAAGTRELAASVSDLKDVESDESLVIQGRRADSWKAADVDD
jgi:hypothetical protein